jgi:hypothetical protein
MKKILTLSIALASFTSFAGIVEETVSIVESQYVVTCGESKELKQRIFKPVRYREGISCADNTGKVKVIIQTESKAKGQPLYKVQILAAGPETNLD